MFPISVNFWIAVIHCLEICPFFEAALGVLRKRGTLQHTLFHWTVLKNGAVRFDWLFDAVLDNSGNCIAGLQQVKKMIRLSWNYMKWFIDCIHPVFDFTANAGAVTHNWQNAFAIMHHWCILWHLPFNIWLWLCVCDALLQFDCCVNCNYMPHQLVSVCLPECCMC